jgi:DNA-binding CsgD family transcriptional regulator
VVFYLGRRPYTELEKILMCELCKLTNNVKYVCDLTGAHFSTVKRFIDEKGIEISRDYKDMLYHRDFSDEELYKMAESGKEIQDIAESTGISRSNVSRKITRYKRKFNINKTHYSKNKTKKLDIETAEWLKLIEDGTKTMTQIADENGISLSGVSRRISRYIERIKNTVDKI